jgi:hypothetical protein
MPFVRDGRRLFIERRWPRRSRAATRDDAGRARSCITVVSPSGTVAIADSATRNGSPSGPFPIGNHSGRSRAICVPTRRPSSGISRSLSASRSEAPGHAASNARSTRCRGTASGTQSEISVSSLRASTSHARAGCPRRSRFHRGRISPCSAVHRTTAPSVGMSGGGRIRMRRPSRASRRSRIRPRTRTVSVIAARISVVVMTSGATVPTQSVRAPQMRLPSLPGWKMRSQRNSVSGPSGRSPLPGDGRGARRSRPARATVQRVRASGHHVMSPTRTNHRQWRRLQVLGEFSGPLIGLEPARQPLPCPVQAELRG